MVKKETKETSIEAQPFDIEEKKKIAQQAIAQMEKEYGRGAIIRLGDKPQDFPHYSTGILSLDIATGIGGFPKGRIIEIYGPEAAGKSLIAEHAVAACQKAGGLCAYIDTEHAMNPAWARKIGVDVDNLYFSQPESGEEAIDIAERFIRTGVISLLVIDSVATLVPQAEIDGTMEDNQMGLLARLMSKGLRKLTGIADETGTTIIFINQLREKIGIMFGNPETTTGGRALKFYSSMRIEVRKVDTIKNGKEVIGIKSKAKIVKNKVGSPFKEAVFDIMFDSGASRSGAIVDYASEIGIIEKTGAWFSYNGIKIGQGRENAKNWIEEHPDDADTIEQEIIKHFQNEDRIDDNDHLSLEPVNSVG